MCSGTPAHCRGPPATPRRALHHAEMILKLSCFLCIFLMYDKGFTDMYPMCCLGLKNWIYVHAMCIKELEMSYVWWEVKNWVHARSQLAFSQSSNDLGHGVHLVSLLEGHNSLHGQDADLTRSILSQNLQKEAHFKSPQWCISFMDKGIRWEKKRLLRCVLKFEYDCVVLFFNNFCIIFVLI